MRLDAEDLGFQIAPRLNAAGRLGQPQLAVELLVTDRPERAAELAQYIDGLNATRQTLERSIQLAAAKQAKELFDPADDAALVLADRGWHPGVIGIVAGRLAERFHRPVVMISWDKAGLRPGIGSARSMPGFNLHAALAECGEFLLAHGGHAAAAGLKIEEGQLAGFRGAFCEVAATRISSDQRVAELFVDVEAPLSAFTLQTVQQLEQLAPVRPGQSPAAALHDRRNAGRPAQTAGPERPSPGHDALAARRDVAGRGLRRRRLGRRSGRARRPDGRRLPPGDQQFPRPPERRVAPGRLASHVPIRPLSRRERVRACGTRPPAVRQDAGKLGGCLRVKRPRNATGHAAGLDRSHFLCSIHGAGAKK